MFRCGCRGARFSMHNGPSRRTFSCVNWNQREISVQDIADFYSLQGCHPPEDRPYTWSMTVSSLDGVIAFQEPDITPGEDSKNVALQSDTDWRLLNGGWMFSEASLISGSCIRREPVVMCPNDEDLLNYRVDELKRSPCPLQVIASGSGNLPLHHKLLRDPQLPTLIVTTPKGEDNLLHTWKESDFRNEYSTPEEYWRARNVEICAFPSTNSQDTEITNWVDVMHYLREQRGISYLDVSAGGRIISRLCEEKLVDEMRLTIAGQLCGSLNSLGDSRPNLFPSENHCYTPSTTPLTPFMGIRFQESHLFLRCAIEYRH